MIKNSIKHGILIGFILMAVGMIVKELASKNDMLLDLMAMLAVAGVPYKVLKNLDMLIPLIAVLVCLFKIKIKLIIGILFAYLIIFVWLTMYVMVLF